MKKKNIPMMWCCNCAGKEKMTKATHRAFWSDKLGDHAWDLCVKCVSLFVKYEYDNAKIIRLCNPNRTKFASIYDDICKELNQ